MKELVKAIIKKTPLDPVLRDWLTKRMQAKELIEWERNGKPVPPPHVIKQRTLIQYAKKYSLKTLVETGTYLGDMVEATKKDFNQIYSIELSEELYEKAKERFKDDGNITLIQGDSGIELRKIIDILDQPALFWLDGHYSAGITARGDKDTPIYEELEHIFNDQDRGHVVIIDDARCFGKDTAYSSIEELRDYVQSKKPDVTIAVENDSIRITPKSENQF